MEEQSSPKWIVFLTTISFLILGAGSLYIAIANSFFLISDLGTLKDTIEFNKGSFYLWGVSFVLLIMVVGIVYTNYLDKSISKHATKRISQIVVVCIIIAILLPQIVHYAVDGYLENRGYQVCEAKSKQWLHVRTIIYFRDDSCVEGDQ